MLSKAITSPFPRLQHALGKLKVPKSFVHLITNDLFVLKANLTYQYGMKCNNNFEKNVIVCS